MVMSTKKLIHLQCESIASDKPLPCNGPSLGIFSCFGKIAAYSTNTDSQMIEVNQAGFSCSFCGFSEVVETKGESDELVKKLTWKDGDPLCPECKNKCWFENYID